MNAIARLLSLGMIDKPLLCLDEQLLLLITWCQQQYPNSKVVRINNIFKYYPEAVSHGHKHFSEMARTKDT